MNRNSGKGIEVLVKPVSYGCNLACGYCFYKKTSGLYPSGLNPLEKTHLMTDTVLEKMIAECMEYSNGKPAIFSWQGGEPTLAGLDFFKKAVGFQSKYGKPGQIISNSVQTNGILIDTNWTGFFKKYNFFIGISLDGPEEANGVYRQYPSGKSCYRETMQAVELLKKEEIDFNVLVTIGAKTAKDPKKLYEFFLSYGLKYLQFIPALDRAEGAGGTNGGGQMPSFAPAPEAYGDFLCGLFDCWWNGGKPKASVRFFDNLCEIAFGMEPTACIFKKQCGSYMVIEHNGDAYPCDLFVGREWKLGNILETPAGELIAKARESFGKLKAAGHADCRGCEWNFVCNNGCLWNRWVKNGNINDRDYFCAAYRRFFNHSYGRLQGAAKSAKRKQ